MEEPLENRNLVSLAPLEPPRALKARTAATPRAATTVRRARAAIRDLLHGRDRRRLLAVVGPCSIHDEDAALAYAERLAPVARASADALVVVMRTYFEKPRTTVGWKGLVNDPHLDGSCDIGHGLALARRILLAVNERDLPCATEVLDPVTPQYLADLVAWAAIGARTTESQTHREMASGLSMPVGFKNGTDGGLAGAANALVSAGHAHGFLGIDDAGATAVVKTRGNPDRHLVLRGGSGGPNFDPATVAEAARLAGEQGIARGVLVDCSHDNSGKDPSRQGAVCRAVASQAAAGQPALLGVMLESHLLPGRQDWMPGAALVPGRSITDACLGFEETEAILAELADSVRRRAAA
ncbi:MAG TPA: 3-deoxy-7-phosphoheptulonate synthase [Myxococcota bacterium]|nr:3-deoxy-7-phosphoheptulonate synthase [Myxococcota bacterium]